MSDLSDGPSAAPTGGSPRGAPAPLPGPMHAAGPADGRRGRRSGREAVGPWAWVREFALVLVIALVISSLLRAFVVQVFWIPSPSMESTLEVRDRIAVSRVSAWTGDIRRGDVVVFRDTHGWLPRVGDTGLGGAVRRIGEFTGFVPANGEQTLVKRVIGTGGDHVACCTAAGRITVNGVAIDEPYLDDGQAPSTVPFDVTVPTGSLWVMGDNRGDSADSRYHMGAGQTPFISASDVVGRARWVIWPLGRWASLGGRQWFDSVPAPR